MSEFIRYEEEGYNQSIIDIALRQKASNQQMISGCFTPQQTSSLQHDKIYQQYIDRMTIKKPTFGILKDGLTEKERIKRASEYLE